MCGIFGVIEPNSNTAAQDTFKGLKDIEYRGYDSWGLAYPKYGILKKKFKGFNIVKSVGFLPEKVRTGKASLAIGHTRWATHGGVTDENAHPHTDCSGKLVLVHNGIVENYLELKKDLKKDHKFRSETDSEIIIHLIEQNLKKTKDLKKAVLTTFKRLEGLSAIVVTDGLEIIAAKVGSPLVAGVLNDGFMIASDPNAILPFTQKLLFLEDNQLVRLNSKLELLDTKKIKKLEPKISNVAWEHTSSEKDNYSHYMMKEIEEQPRMLKLIAENSKDLAKLANLVKRAYGTFLIGCGTASYACIAGVYLLSKFSKKHVNFAVGSEFNYLQDYLTQKSLLLAISQSGESIDVLEPVSLAKKRGAKIASLVNVLGSSLYRISDRPVLLNAGIEKAVASTKAMVSMIAHLIVLSFMIKGQKSKGKKIIIDSQKEIERILKNKTGIQELAGKIFHKNHIYVLGRGLSYPVALEAALKIKEISYIHAEGFASGELKHGVIALIEKGTPVIAFVPEDETREATISNAIEVKARGAYVIGVGATAHPVFDFFYKVSDTGASSIIPHIVFAQLLAYYLSVKLGHNPDKPRNLAKSVVVR